MARALIRPERYTYADYYSWPDEIRCELIDGVFYNMTPAPSPTHQSVLVALSSQVFTALRGSKCKVFFAPFDVRLPKAREDDGSVDTVVQPDLVVICDPSKIDKRGCRGAPDWVVEILSPSTAEKDQTIKRALYERHGVREYWIIAPESRGATLLTLVANGKYRETLLTPATGKSPVAAVAGLEIDWGLVF